MQVSLQEFLSAGSFGRIELGASRSAVERHLGPPDDWDSGALSYETSAIWKYGDIELHFQPDTLSMIFMDDFSVLSGGEKIKLNSWGITGHLTCSQAERFLTEASILYRRESFPYNDNGIQLITGAGTVLSFCGENASQITVHALYRQIAANEST